VLLFPLKVLAQDQSETFPTESVALLDRELPQMNKAVAEKDRTYFGPALERVQAFLGPWAKREGGSVLERNAACTDAVTDFLIVGLCKISPPGSICEPDTFFPKVQRNIEQCRSTGTQASGSPQK